MTQHTPGPWMSGDHDWHTILGPHTRFRTDPEGGRHLSSVAVVDRSDDEAEDAANARLVRRAPELAAALAACRDCLAAECRRRNPAANGGAGVATPEEQVALELARLALDV